MSTANPAHGLQGSRAATRKITGWYISAAVLLIFLGIFAITEPFVASLAVSRLVGWLLILGGVMHLIGAFRGSGAKRVIFQVLVGIAYIIGGFYSLMHALLAIGTLTLLLAAVILAGGALELISYFRFKGENASGWMLLNGIINLLLGGMILFHWPSSSIWAIGTLVGLTLLMTGMTRLMFALTARKLARLAAQ